jgi:hypothetical protein
VSTPRQVNFRRAAPARAGSGANGSVMKDHVMMRRFVAVEALFNGRHFDRQIIILCVSDQPPPDSE